MNCAEKLLEPTIFFNLYKFIKKILAINGTYVYNDYFKVVKNTVHLTTINRTWKQFFTRIGAF